MALASCSALQPFETSVIDPDAYPNSQSAAARLVKEQADAAAASDLAGAPISVCYNKLIGTPEQVLDIARQECGKGPPPQLVEQKLDLTSCPLMTPIRATFKCAGH